MVKCHILTKQGNNASRGLAFVTFESAYCAALAVENAPDGKSYLN